MLGTLPPFEVASPWWPDVEPVVAAARRRFGVVVTVLRVLRTTGRGPEGGDGAYLAEAAEGSWSGHLQAVEDDELRRLAEQEDALRLPWARHGGVATDVRWADARLAAAGTYRIADAVQVKSWNLSSVLRLPTAAGSVWCKHVPPFLAHEGAVVAALCETDPDLAPPVLGRRRDPDGSSVALLAGVPGVDQWEAPETVLTAMATRWIDVQARWADGVDELVRLGVPDRRSAPLLDAVRALAARPDVRTTLTDAELAALDRAVAALPDRLAALDACGLPATLVHGDLHPGNWIGDGRRLVLVDWGDSLIGHPMLDVLAFLDRVPAGAMRERVRETVVRGWEQHCPEADPRRAIELVEPIAALRGAVVYRTFLDGIEATERDYHESDVPQMLRRALRRP